MLFALVFGMNQKINGLFFFLGILVAGCSPKQAVEWPTDQLYTLAQAKKGIFLSGSDTLYYKTIGKGPDTILLVHGFGPFPSAQWESQAIVLSFDALVVIPDMLFFGQSSGPDTALMPAYQAQKLSLLMHSLHVNRYGIVGHSYGGLVSTYLAEQEGPSKIHSLVLIDPLNKYYPRTILDSVQRVSGKPIENILVPSEPKDLNCLVDLTFSRKVAFPKALADRLLEAVEQEHPESQRSLLRILQREEATVRAMELPQGIPTLLLWGAKDKLIPLESGVQLSHAIPGSTLIVRPHDGHAPHLESPIAVNRILQQFYKEQKRRLPIE